MASTLRFDNWEDSSGTPIVSGSDGVYTKNNILGTVSQSDGLPTGAILESGSNVNGYFIKYADGTLLQYLFRSTDGTFAAGSEQNVSWTAPAENVGTKSIMFQHDYSGMYNLSGSFRMSLVSARLRQAGKSQSSAIGNSFSEGSSSSSRLQEYWISVGRWF